MFSLGETDKNVSTCDKDETNRVVKRSGLKQSADERNNLFERRNIVVVCLRRSPWEISKWELLIKINQNDRRTSSVQFSAEKKTSLNEWKQWTRKCLPKNFSTIKLKRKIKVFSLFVEKDQLDRRRNRNKFEQFAANRREENSHVGLIARVDLSTCLSNSAIVEPKRNRRTFFLSGRNFCWEIRTARRNSSIKVWRVARIRQEKTDPSDLSPVGETFNENLLWFSGEKNFAGKRRKSSLFDA